MRMKMKHLLIFFVLPIFTHNTSAQDSAVKVWETTLEIPTYLLDPPVTAPIFDCDYSYQRARRSVYPYALNDNMTRNKENVEYKALYLENEYVKLCVLPEIGGRLFYAVDKTNGYDFFYRQDVIKPANVGMLGAWISGGVEWNVFHHHRATSHDMVNYKLVENEDGSKTIWIGETELRHRMSWSIGMTLHPGKSYIEITGRLINSTPNNNSILFWSNAATHANENYQIIFPQSTEFGTFHSKEYFCHWPITTTAYTGVEEYKHGIDASWYKNHPKGNSIFAHDLQDGFVAGYDHGINAGTIMVGNHHINKGAKFWTWGPNSEWDSKILTDNAGHYIELMMGAYSDNQPDYTWLNTTEVKSFTQYFYGIRDIGGVKKSSKNAALNLDLLGEGKMLLGVNGTEVMNNLTLTVVHGDNTLFSEEIDVAPDLPFVRNVTIDNVIKEHELTMTLIDGNGRKLLSYTPIIKDPHRPLPAIVEPPLLPEEIKNNEECYLVGLRNLQFFNPFIQPTDYFMEVLRRDPYDTRSNTQMGVYWRQRGDNEKAAMYLRRAIQRQTNDYTRPRDCEALYNLGLILKSEGKTEAAMDTLYRAAWDYTYNSPANFQLAQLYMVLGDYNMALMRLNEAIRSNGNNLAAINLKSSILRIQNNKEEAKDFIDDVLAHDPLNAYATYENYLLRGDEYFKTLLHNNVESYLELAIKYLHNGLEDHSIKLLQYIDSKQQYPTVKLWLGYLADKAGNKSVADGFFNSALQLSTDYCHPFRLETISVLEKAKEYYPNNYKLYYYTGNLFYDKQPLRAINEWERCVSINPSFAMAWRNLGYAHWKYTKNYEEAAKAYVKAIETDPTQPIFLEEIAQVWGAMGEDVQVRYDLLKSMHDVGVKRFYPVATEVITGTFVGDYDYVLGLLRNVYFPTREGVANFHDVYVDALLLAGEEKLAKGAHKEAIELFEEAFTFPENHQVFYKDTRYPRDAQIYYMLANAYEKMGNDSKAQLNYKNASEVNVRMTNYRYWQALALKKIGKENEAEILFKALIQDGERNIVQRFINFYGAEGTTGETVETINTKAYYTIGLGELGLGNSSKAREYFKKSLALKPDNLWSMVMLRQL
jgi:tetratricopeptide (TPR) repeat protein